jgi:hypothetical protein
MISLILAIGCAWFSREAFLEGRNSVGWLNLVLSAANAGIGMASIS